MSANTSPFDSLLVEQIPSLAKRARHLCQDGTKAQDLVQDTLLRALENRAQFEQGTNLRAWLHRILFNLFVSAYRRNRREAHSLDRFGGDATAWIKNPQALSTPSLSPRVAVAIQTLPEKLARVVHLVDLDELSYREAAEELEVPVGTIMSRLHRGRRRLANALGVSDFDSTRCLEAA